MPDLELREGSQQRFRQHYRRPVAPRSFRSSISSRTSRLKPPISLACPRGVPDLELRETSEPRFRRHFQRSGAPRSFRTSISSSISKNWSTAKPRDLDFADNFKDFELRGKRSEAPRSFLTSISSTISRNWSTAKPLDLDFADSFEDFELRGKKNQKKIIKLLRPRLIRTYVDMGF